MAAVALTKMKSVIEFEHGETTCATEPGKFCMFVYVRKFGMETVCHLFGNEPLDAHLEGAKKGWVARCPQCLEKFNA